MRSREVEFKISENDREWKDIGITITSYCNTDREADSQARHLSRVSGAEVRWNWRGSLQGHYVSD